MNSKMRKTLVLSVAALVVAVSAGTAAVWAVNDDDEPGTSQTIDAPGGTCLEGATECDDIPSSDGAAGGTCLEGSVECDDNPAAGGAAGGTCLVGTPDCNDTPGFLGDDS